jgi:peptidyl-prolyl cis-trans isomerase B (cyclophilin B)
MADHKAPTQVVIAPYEETSQLQKLVSTYAMPFFVVALVATVFILWNQTRQENKKQELDKSWNQLAAQVTMATIGTGGQLPSPGTLGALAENLRDTSAGAWTKALEVRSFIESEDWSGAEAALAQLEQDYPNHPIVRDTLPIGEEGALESMAVQLRSYIESERAFVDANPGLFQLAALPEGSPRVKITTSAGDIIVGLFEDRAPEHVANFIKLASSGYYDGTKFHRTIPGFMVQGGDPNTKSGDPSTWGQGGPEYKIAQEPNNLYHFKGVLAMAKMPGDSESSGSQFYITTGTPHHLDGQHTVLAFCLKGLMWFGSSKTRRRMRTLRSQKSRRR